MTHQSEVELARVRAERTKAVEGIGEMCDWCNAAQRRAEAADARVAKLEAEMDALRSSIQSRIDRAQAAEACVDELEAERDEARASAHRSQEQFVDVSHRFIEAKMGVQDCIDRAMAERTQAIVAFLRDGTQYDPATNRDRRMHGWRSAAEYIERAFPARTPTGQ